MIKECRFESLQEQEIFVFLWVPDTLKPIPICDGGVCWGEKQPEREADLLPLPSTEVKNIWNYTSLHYTSS